MDQSYNKIDHTLKKNYSKLFLFIISTVFCCIMASLLSFTTFLLCFKHSVAN